MADLNTMRATDMPTEMLLKAVILYGEVLKVAVERDHDIRLINLLGDGRDFHLSVVEAA